TTLSPLSLHDALPISVASRPRHGGWLRTAADALEQRRLTPAILFFPSRRECDEAARLLGGRPAPDEARRAERIQEWIAQVPRLAQHPMLPALRRGGGPGRSTPGCEIGRAHV